MSRQSQTRKKRQGGRTKVTLDKSMGYVEDYYN